MMRTLDDLLSFMETHCSYWSRTQRQIYIDWVFASIVAVSEGQTIDTTSLFMFARLRAEILDRKKIEELSEGGKFIDLKLGRSYQDLAENLTKDGMTARSWSQLEEPENGPPDKKPKRWPLVLKSIYVAGALVMAFKERLDEPAIPETTISNITKDVGKFLKNNDRIYSSKSTLYEVWPRMFPVAHFCAALLKLFPPVRGQTLNAKSRLKLSANVPEFLRLAEDFEQVVRRSPDVSLEKIIPTRVGVLSS